MKRIILIIMLLMQVVLLNGCQIIEKPEINIITQPKKENKMEFSTAFLKWCPVVLGYPTPANPYRPDGWEGLYANNPNDPGGATMRGVIWATYLDSAQKVLGEYPTVQGHQNLSKESAAKIAWHTFWYQKPWAMFADGRFNIFFTEVVWGSGPGSILSGNIYKLQECIYTLGHTEITLDGMLGPQTYKFVECMTEDEKKWCLDQLFVYREAQFRSFINAQYFIVGWLNRMNDIKYIIDTYPINNI